MSSGFFNEIKKSDLISIIGFSIALLVGITKGITNNVFFENAISSKMEGFILFMIIFIFSEKISSMINQKEIEEKFKKINDISEKILDSINIRSISIDVQKISNGCDGALLLSDLLKNASSVKNTYFVSLDKDKRNEIIDYTFEVGQSIIKNITDFIKGGKYWSDILSEIGKERALQLAASFKSENIQPKTYHAYTINHDKPMINFIIIEYGKFHPSIVLFGWGLHESQPRAPVFISRDKEIVNYFYNYFLSIVSHKDTTKIDFDGVYMNGNNLVSNSVDSPKDTLNNSREPI